jgi:hypothetical protein
MPLSLPVFQPSALSSIVNEDPEPEGRAAHISTVGGELLQCPAAVGALLRDPARWGRPLTPGMEKRNGPWPNLARRYRNGDGAGIQQPVDGAISSGHDRGDHPHRDGHVLRAAQVRYRQPRRRAEKSGRPVAVTKDQVTKTRPMGNIERVRGWVERDAFGSAAPG